MISYFQNKLKKDREVVFQVKIHPSASKNEIKEILEDKTVKINIAAPPEKGKANRELVKFLAQQLGVEKNNVTLISGETSPQKRIRVISPPVKGT